MKKQQTEWWTGECQFLNFFICTLVCGFFSQILAEVALRCVTKGCPWLLHQFKSKLGRCWLSFIQVNNFYFIPAIVLNFSRDKWALARFEKVWTRLWLWVRHHCHELATFWVNEESSNSVSVRNLFKDLDLSATTAWIFWLHSLYNYVYMYKQINFSSF